MFIHGDDDKFVPFYMLDELYEACSSEKQKISYTWGEPRTLRRRKS